MNLPAGTGRDAFHCVPNCRPEDGDAVERVPTGFRGSMRELVRRILSPWRGEGEASSRGRPSRRLLSKSVSEKCAVASCSSSSLVLRPRFCGEFRGRGRATRTRTRREPNFQTRSKAENGCGAASAHGWKTLWKSVSQPPPTHETREARSGRDTSVLPSLPCGDLGHRALGATKLPSSCLPVTVTFGARRRLKRRERRARAATDNSGRRPLPCWQTTFLCLASTPPLSLPIVCDGQFAKHGEGIHPNRRRA
jgi:hypothetical protein